MPFVMGYQEQSNLFLFAQFQQQGHDGVRGFGVQAACRLISDNHFWIVGQGAGNGDTLPLP